MRDVDFSSVRIRGFLSHVLCGFLDALKGNAAPECVLL